MKKLYALSDAQRTKLSEWAQQWIAIGLSTEPADRPTFERAVGMLYVEQGRKAPSVIWTGSPLAVDLVMMHLTSNAATPEFDLSFLPQCVAEHVLEVVRVETGARVIRGTPKQLRDTTTVRRYFHGPLHAGGWWTLSGRCAARYGSPANASFLQDVCGIELPAREAKLARALQNIAKSAGCWLSADTCVVVSERPLAIRRDQRGRLHSENAPALIFRDGSAFAFWHGVRMPLDVILDHSRLTLERILKESNAEVARVMVSLYGEARFLRDVGAEVVHPHQLHSRPISRLMTNDSSRIVSGCCRRTADLPSSARTARRTRCRLKSAPCCSTSWLRPGHESAQDSRNLAM